ncbi:MAG: hypothetical protein O3A01_05880 [bacterium]|nr:hypothetical protein [bacterium]
MNEIICPHCNKAFKIDEAGYADLLKQVRNHEFDKEIHERLASAEKDKQSAVKLAEEKTKNELSSNYMELQKQFTELKSEKDKEITTLQAKLSSAETEKKLALSEAVHTLEKERDALTNQLTIKDTETKLRESTLKDKYCPRLRII